MKHSIIIWTTTLFLGIFSMSLVILPSSQQPLKNIHFISNVLPEVKLIPRVGKNNESFRITWNNNILDLEIFFNATYNNNTRLFSLNDFEDDFNANIEIQINQNKDNITFGYIISNLELISDFIHSAYYKIENSFPFDIDEIELLEYPTEDVEKNATILGLPDNLFLSFQNLEMKGFTIDYISKKECKFKGNFKQATLNFDPIIFSGNIIQIIGGTSGTPLDFSDVYDADITTEYVFTDDYVNNTASPFNLLKNYFTNPLRPAEWRTLRIYINVTNYLAGGQLRVRGKDVEDNTQSEYLTINASGSYPTTLFYSLLQDLEFSASGHDYNYTVSQMRQGFVWYNGHSQYTFDASLKFGNGTTQGETWFSDNDLQITFNNPSNRIMDNLRYTYIIFGQLEDETEKTSSRGIHFKNLKTSGNYYWTWSSSNYNNNISMYSCTFSAETRTIYRGQHGRLWNSIFLENSEISGRIGIDYYNNILIKNILKGLFFSI